MKKSERRLLEEKLRYVAMEDVELDPERSQQMLEETKARFLQQSTVKDTPTTSARHQIGRRVLIVSAAAVLFVVLSFGYTVLMPESVSHARGFVRNAAIWVNNTLHLGYEFEEPVENRTQFNGEDEQYDGSQFALANIHYPLVCLNASGFELQSVTTSDANSFSKVSLLYSNGIQSYTIILAPVAEDAITSLPDDTFSTVSCSFGELVCWESDSKCYALTYYSGMEVSINSTSIPYDDFLTLCQTLQIIN